MTAKRRNSGWPPPKKSLGQVMLVDADAAYEIVKLCGAGEGDRVFEIGPGRGILTAYFLDRGIRITACEIDRRMAALLRKRFGGRENFNLLERDILQLDLEEVFPGESYQAVGNLPYHLTSGILFKFFDYVRARWDEGKQPRVSSLTVMVQKEVADRLVSAPGTRDWGILSLFTSIYGDIERLLEVSADNFKPRPKVDSSIIKIVFRGRYPFIIEDYQFFREIIKSAFGARRKMLKNTISRFHPPEDLDIDLHKRPEELTAAEFAAMANAISAVQ